jgi:hypothetical protein
LKGGHCISKCLVSNDGNRIYFIEESPLDDISNERYYLLKCFNITEGIEENTA